jgi:hypothetical protein
MSRVLAALALFLAVVPFAAAQPQPGEPIPLTLSPATLPEPALRYRLLPDGRDLVPGNAAAIHYRSMAAFAENKALLDAVRGGSWDIWMTMPLKDLPRPEVAARLAEQQHLLDNLNMAAHRRDCDWQLAGRPEGIALLLPEVQTFRAVIRVIVVQARYELAGGHTAAALQALQPGYALSYHLGRGQTLIHVLVGAAAAAILDKELEEILQQPECPNLYWALTVLPRPYLDLSNAIEEEGTLLERTWPALKRLEEGPMSPEQIHALRKEIVKPSQSLNLRPATIVDSLNQTADQERAYPASRQSLLEQGLSAQEVDAMPLFQVVALEAIRRYHRAWDDYVQWIHVPNFGSEPGCRQAFQRLQTAAGNVEYRVLLAQRLGSNFSFLQPPPLDRINNAVTRTDRRFEALRCVEALRLHAAKHGGRLPASLKDVTEVPVPVDPRTGKPFTYEIHGDKAKLSAPLPEGEKTPLYERLSYELTLQGAPR